MSPRKLSEQDKQEILILYREPDETTSTLAARYNVSSSTISRFLKNNLSETEYEELIKQKRQTRRSKSNSAAAAPEEPEQQAPEEPAASDTAKFTPPILQKKEFAPPILVSDRNLDEDEDEEEDDEDLNGVNVIALEELLGEDLADLDDEDDEDDEDEDGELDDWETGDRHKDYLQNRAKNAEVKVLPLKEASFPKICYLVVDRSAELITKPLKDFADLGNIPIDESKQETLPVFDNHRVAKRFSHRSQRVIKVPDSSMLEKTCSYLKAKGITRLLLDGQVFSIPSS